MKYILLMLVSVILVSCGVGVSNTNTIVFKEGSDLKDDEYSNNVFFDNLNTEYRLAKYFLTANELKAYKLVPKEVRRTFMMNFWKAKDPNPVTEANEFADEIKNRIRFANSFYTHYQQGWTTDRGRIYIKFGEPFEKTKELTGGNSRFPNKAYEVWKYRNTTSMTYIFMDTQGYGNFRMIYAEGEGEQMVLPEWQSYLGDSFDESDLQ